MLLDATHHLPTILIAEDERILQELYAELCAEEGLVIIQAFDGLAAWDAISHRKDISLIILDLMMPGMSGEAIIEKISRQPDHVPVVVVTAAHGHASDSLEEIGRGKIVRIAKGEVGIRTIVQAIATYLAHS